MGVTSYFIDEEWTKHNYYLQARKLSLTTRMKTLQPTSGVSARKWQVKKLAAVCSDNAATVTKSVREGLNDCAHLPCAAHILQLCVEDVLADVRLSKTI